MCVRGCWKSCANESNIVEPRFGDHRTKEMFEIACSKVWPVSNFAHQLPAIRNKRSANGRSMKHLSMMGPFARGLRWKDWNTWISNIWAAGWRNNNNYLLCIYFFIARFKYVNWFTLFFFSEKKHPKIMKFYILRSLIDLLFLQVIFFSYITGLIFRTRTLRVLELRPLFDKYVSGLFAFVINSRRQLAVSIFFLFLMRLSRNSKS